MICRAHDETWFRVAGNGCGGKTVSTRSIATWKVPAGTAPAVSLRRYQAIAERSGIETRPWSMNQERSPAKPLAGGTISSRNPDRLHSLHHFG